MCQVLADVLSMVMMTMVMLEALQEQHVARDDKDDDRCVGSVKMFQVTKTQLDWV